jgi:hypothetical protein
MSSIIFPVFFGTLYVPFLRIFISADQQQYYSFTCKSIVHAVAFAFVKPKFKHSVTERFGISEIPAFHAINPFVNRDAHVRGQRAIPVDEWALTIRSLVESKFSRSRFHVFRSVRYVLQPARRIVGCKLYLDMALTISKRFELRK